MCNSCMYKKCYRLPTTSVKQCIKIVPGSIPGSGKDLNTSIPRILVLFNTKIIVHHR